MAINFKLRSISSKKNADAPLYIMIREGGVNVQFRSCISVNVEAYRLAFMAGASKQARNRYNDSEEGKRVAQMKQTALDQIKLAISEGITDAKTIKQRVDDALVYNQAKETRDAASRFVKSGVLDYLDDFLKRVSNCEVLTAQKKPFSESAKEYYKKTRRYFGSAVSENYSLTFDDLSTDIADKFCAWMDKNNIMKSTQKNILSCMGSICRRAWSAGLIDASKIGVLDLWKLPKPKEDEVRTSFALDEEEVEALWNLAASGTLSKEDALVADMALSGIYSMQRFSDFSRFSPDMVTTDSKGRKYLHFKQDKTENFVDVPLVGRLNEVLARNGYNFTKFDPLTRTYKSRIVYSTFNRGLRSVLGKLVDTVPSLGEMMPTQLTAVELKQEKHFQELLKLKEEGKIVTASGDYYTLRADLKEQIANGAMGTNSLWKKNAKGEVIKPKWMMASTHVCRRTGITLALYAGILTDAQIMKISGHRTLSAFKKYDKRDVQRRNADIFDALQRAEADKNKRGKIINIAVNQ